MKEKPVDEGKEHILHLLQKSSRGTQPIPQVPVSYEEQQQQHVQQAQHAQREHKTQQMQKHEQILSQSPPAREPITYYDGSVGPPTGAKTGNPSQVPVLMSKVLNVANIPFDMPPKELFDIFAETGAVDGSYIFPYADQLSRRFGHIVMSSFFTAQKVLNNHTHPLKHPESY